MAIKFCCWCTAANTYKKAADHQDECVRNYEGVGGRMEATAIVHFRVFATTGKCMVHRVFVGDGDLKAFRPDGKPYSEKQTVKLECIGHEHKEWACAFES